MECIYENTAQGYLGFDSDKKQIQLCQENEAVVWRLKLQFHENII